MDRCEYNDHVICTNCDTEQIVDPASNTCLNCGTEGTLKDIQQEVPKNIGIIKGE